MKVNFDIIENYALGHEGQHIDLHNNFDFVNFDYNIVDREITLTWKKSRIEEGNKNEPEDLVLLHKEVDYLAIADQNQKDSFNDNTCLGEVTFSPLADRWINKDIYPQSKPNNGDDILYLFEDGKVIRICCGQIELKVMGKYIKLKTFLGTSTPDENTKSRENYRKLIGEMGKVIDYDELDPNKVLVLFDKDLDDFWLENHNPIKNSLYIRKSDLDW